MEAPFSSTERNFLRQVAAAVIVAIPQPQSSRSAKRGRNSSSWERFAAAPREEAGPPRGS